MKKSQAVRSRISPKLIVASSVGYFDRAYIPSTGENSIGIPFYGVFRL